MPDIIQSLKTKFEFVAISLALLGMMSTGVYVYTTQSKTLVDHGLDIVRIEAQQDASSVIAQTLRADIDAKLLPSILSNQKEIVRHETRIEAMEKSARADRELLLEIRNDLKWLRGRQEP